MKNSRIVTLATFAMVVFGGVETAFAGVLNTFTTINVALMARLGGPKSERIRCAPHGRPTEAV